MIEYYAIKTGLPHSDPTDIVVLTPQSCIPQSDVRVSGRAAMKQKRKSRKKK